MHNTLIKTAAVLLALSATVCASAQQRGAQEEQPDFAPTPQEVNNMKAPVLEDYFTTVYPAKAKGKVSVAPTAPDSRGFIRRWSLLEPIPMPDIRSNAIFTDSYLREEFGIDRYPMQRSLVPYDGQKVKLDKKTSLSWHCLDSKRYNVKLYRLATGLGLHPTEALYHAVTVVIADRDMTVRMAVGSNSASMWWVNEEEALLLSGDRRMVVDDCVSRKITLHAGKNIVRGAIINGPGMSDFCLRFLDLDGKPVTDLKVSNE